MVKMYWASIQCHWTSAGHQRLILLPTTPIHQQMWVIWNKLTFRCPSYDHNILKWPQKVIKIILTFKDHILLWQEFCPQFPWVGPLAYNTSDIGALSGSTTNYLGEYWDSTAEIQKVHFRQFGWTADGDDQGTDSNKNHFWTDWVLIGGRGLDSSLNHW